MSEPEVTSPITPDQPLVIDLPDGQKLVVGNMVAGSVIEVATWRGTGRPDSRTSRLMLGMSPGSLTPTVVQTESGEKAKLTPKDRVAALLKSLQAFPKNLFIKKSESATKDEKKFDPKPESEKSAKSLSLKSGGLKSKRAFFLDFLVRSSHEQAKEEQSKQEQIDIDKWLDSIRSKSAQQTPPRNSATKAASSTAKSRKAKPATRKSKGK
jgi:hypothetical protein